MSRQIWHTRSSAVDRSRVVYILVCVRAKEQAPSGTLRGEKEEAGSQPPEFHFLLQGGGMRHSPGEHPPGDVIHPARCCCGCRARARVSVDVAGAEARPHAHRQASLVGQARHRAQVGCWRCGCAAVEQGARAAPRITCMSRVTSSRSPEPSWEQISTRHRSVNIIQGPHYGRQKQMQLKLCITHCRSPPKWQCAPSTCLDKDCGTATIPHTNQQLQLDGSGMMHSKPGVRHMGSLIISR